MPITKFNLIKNVGRFSNCVGGRDVDLARYTLVFAENGRGKTTLCSILRSLNLGDSAFITGRATLGAPGAPEISIAVDGNNIQFADGRWTSQYDHLAIFDETFVSENVYSGDAVGHDHRRSLYQVIVGKEGRDLAKKYEELDASVRRKNDEMRAARDAIQMLAPQGIAVAAYIALPADPEAEKKIAGKEKEIQSAKEFDTLQARQGFVQLPTPELPLRFEGVLGMQVDGIAANVGEAVAAHLTTHGMQRGGEGWLSEGLRYGEKGETCPFCAQSTSNANFVKTLQGFFSKEYSDLKSRVQTLRTEVESALSDRVAGGIETTIATNDATAEFWKNHCALAVPSLDGRNVGGTLRALRHAAIELVDRKAHTVLEAIDPGEEFKTRVAQLNDVADAIARYNEAVKNANDVIAAMKAKLRTIDGAAAGREIAQLKAQQRRHEKKTIEICDALDARTKEKEEIEKQKDVAKKALDKYTETVMARYEHAINRYLDDFNTGFTIAKTAHDYRGAGVPRSSYQIVINKVPIELGDTETPLHTPSFKNTLSSGDRSTLALAFFLAQLEHDADKANKVVVFDDPFSSQDRFRQSETVSKIVRCGTTCAQTIVLSHDLQFLEMLWTRLQPKGAERKTLQFVRRSEENTHIEIFDIDKATNAAYRHDLEAIQQFYSEGEGTPLDVARKIRPVVEAHLRRTSTELVDEKNLGTMLAKIREGKEAHPLANLYQDLDDMNEYAVRVMHGEKPGAPVHQINDQELRGCIRKMRRVVGLG